MEISVFVFSVVLSCVLLWSVPLLEGKTVSLNELIAAESKRLQDELEFTKHPQFEPKSAFGKSATKQLEGKNSAFKTASKAADVKNSILTKTANKELQEDNSDFVKTASKELEANNSTFSKTATRELDPKTAFSKTATKLPITKSAFIKTATQQLETKKSAFGKTAAVKTKKSAFSKTAAAEAKRSPFIKTATRELEAKKSAFKTAPKAAEARNSAFSKSADKELETKKTTFGNTKVSEVRSALFGERPNKLKGLLSDLETEASDVIKVLRNQDFKRQQNKATDKSAEAERFSLNKLLLRDTRKPREFSITELITPRGKKFLSSLKYRKKFQIKSPLKPKKLKNLQPRFKRKNKSVKRQVNNDRFSKQYIPLLRSLSMLFDNVIGEYSGEFDGERVESIEGRESNLVVRKVPFARRRNIESRKISDDITDEEGKRKVEEDIEGKESKIAFTKVPIGKNRRNNRFKARQYERKSVASDEGNGNEINEKKRIFRNFTNATSAEHVSSEERIPNGQGNTSRTEENSKERMDKYNGQETNSTTETTECNTQQETTITTTENSYEAITIETTSATTDITTSSDVINFGPDSNIPSVPPGNTTGIGRNHTGLSEGSSPTFHGSFEGNITRDHRDRELSTGSGENQSDAANDEENPDDDTRVRADGGSSGGLSSEEFRRPVYRGGSYEIQETQVFEEVIANPRRSTELEGENIIKTGGNKTESSQNLPESIRGGRIIEDSISNDTKPLQSEANHEKSFDNVIKSIPSDRGFPVGHGKHSKEVKETGAADETVTIDDLSDPVKMLRASTNRKPAYVTIIDGYSVARDINGRNKLSEHTIRIHS